MDCLRFGTIGIALGAVVLSGSAMAQTGSRQTASVTFGEQRPGHATGAQLAIDYVNPAEASAKPPAVAKVVIKLARGTAFDTSVPARCKASDAELMTAGAGACPAASRVGSGELDLDTGIPGPNRVLANDLVLLNGEKQIILLTESKDDPRVRLVARAVIDGATLTTEVPPVPGGPPDGYVAIKRVRLKLERRSRGRRSYLSTPASCPSSHSWTSRAAFTYRDGISQTVASSSACTRGVALRRDNKPPRIRVRGVPRRRCARRSFRARIRIGERWSGLRRATLRLNGRRLVTTRRRRFSRRVGVDALQKRRNRLTVAARDRAGNRSRKRVSFRVC